MEKGKEEKRKEKGIEGRVKGIEGRREGNK